MELHAYISSAYRRNQDFFETGIRQWDLAVPGPQGDPILVLDHRAPAGSSGAQ